MFKFKRISKLMEMITNTHKDHLQKFNRNLYLYLILNKQKLMKIIMKCKNIIKTYNKYKKMVTNFI